jgi:hypothetical protein
LPRATFGKGFAEGLRDFAERLGPSAKQPTPVVPGLTSISTMNFVVAIQTCPELENSS